jgi:hypothetical protein
MIRSTAFRNIAGAMTLGICGLLATAAPARAGDYCEPACRVVYVTRYEAREITRVYYVTVYDHRGRPYRVARTCTEVIKVPVTRRVVVCR